MISAVVYTALSPLVAGGLCTPSKFAHEAIGPPGTTAPALSAPRWPAIRFTIISGFAQALICGTDTVDTDDTRVQVDVVDRTYGGMIYLRDQVIAIMQSVSPPCVRDGYFETYDFETTTHRGILDFVFYPSTGSGSP